MREGCGDFRLEPKHVYRVVGEGACTLKRPTFDTTGTEQINELVAFRVCAPTSHRCWHQSGTAWVRDTGARFAESG